MTASASFPRIFFLFTEEYEYTEQQDAPYEILSPVYNTPFLSKISSALIPQYHRIRRGVYDECCRKSCSMSELQSYCNPNGPGYNPLND